MLDFLQKTKQDRPLHWSVLIEDNYVYASLWEIVDQKVSIIGQSGGVSWQSDDELLSAVDDCLTDLSSKIPEGVDDPSQTVFGLPPSWISEGEIEQSRLGQLKLICDKLSLKPSGFVVLPEAIAHYIKYNTETPFSGILLGFSESVLLVSIFTNGSLLGQTSVSRSVSVSEDLIEGLTRLKDQITSFPPHMVLYDHKASMLEEFQNELGQVNWDGLGDIKFMHIPKIDIFRPEDKVVAVSLAGGSELGANNGLLGVAGQNSLDNKQSDQIEDSVVENEQVPDKSFENYQHNNVEPSDIKPEDFGFSVGTSQQVVQDNISYPQTTQSLPSLKQRFEDIKTDFEHRFGSKIKVRSSRFGLSGLFSKLSLNLGSGWSLPNILVLLSVLLIGLILFYWFVPKATVTVYVSPKKIEDRLLVDTSSDVKTSEQKILVSGEKTISTTGTKTVGEKAKGSVKVQNGTAFPIGLNAGTILVGSGDLRFATLKTASVSAALSPSNPGNATIEVEALSIGSEYNVAKDEIFKVGNYPKAEVDAVAINTFEGGSSRQISAVSLDDVKNIEKQLNEDLTKQAMEKIKDQVSQDYLMVESLIVSDVVDENFSNKAGDEATSLKLALELEFTAKLILKEDLLKITNQKLESSVPDGFVLRSDQITYGFEDLEGDNLPIRVNANLLPSVDTNDLVSKISGKYPEVARSYFVSSVPGFVRAEFRLYPALPGFLGNLPRVKKNIDLSLSSL